MKMNDVRALARERGVKIGNLSKIMAIRKIQLSEGNFDCYGRAQSGYCDQHGCLFIDDCLRATDTGEPC